MEHFDPLAPNEEQMKNNPNKKWEKLLEPIINRLYNNFLLVTNESDSEKVEYFEKYLDEEMKGFSKEDVKAKLISKEELRLRVLELYAMRKVGAGSTEKEKEKHNSIKTIYIDKLALALAEKFRKLEYDTVYDELQKEIVPRQEKCALNDEETQTLRDKFDEYFAKVKEEEYNKPQNTENEDE